MAYRNTINYFTGNFVSVAIQRHDRKNYDFADSTFKTTPSAPRAVMAEDPVNPGSFILDISVSPQTVFTDGPYISNFYDVNSGENIGSGDNYMVAGDDAVAPGGGSGGGVAELDLRLEAFLIGRAVRNNTLKTDTFMHPDNPNQPVYRTKPDGQGGRITEDLRGS